ncbi:MAG: metallophosphoesterase family protein, partial [Nocardioidaceae bacterium]|nr:metallophosphoesterase family protein [Nocardioidaceae bacterium]
QDIADRALGLTGSLRQPTLDETVALLVSDRHDNVGMDPVAHAIATAGGATLLFDAGDDTSTGEPWETFSLDSLVDEFSGFDGAYVVPGNHDNGEFVPAHFDDAGFTVLTGEPVETSDGIRLLGIADPRSSGLGSWRTPVGISFEDQAAQLADTACEADAAGERVSTLIVHDPDLGTPALERGCADLLLSGHLHVQVGPDVVSEVDGEVGVTYTNGTTGGAAYAVALGTKLRRDAQVTLITYRDGVALGLQPVTIGVSGDLVVAPFSRLPATR